MRKIEIALLIAAVIAIKWDIVFLLPGGGLMVILFLLLLSMFYFFFGFVIFNNIRFREAFKRESYKGINAKNIVSGIFKGWVFSIAVMGILFKIMSWPGANFNLILGLFGLAVLLIFLILKSKTQNVAFNTVGFKRISFVIILSGIFLAMSENMMIRVKHRDHPGYAEALIKVNSNPENLEYQKELERQADIIYSE